MSLPVEKIETVWNDLQNRYLHDPKALKELGPSFECHFSIEDFTDTYFDTPSRQILQTNGGIRHRKRTNLTNPDDPKSDRELIQVKIDNISENPLERGELKFKVKYYQKIKTPEDLHPLLGLIKRRQRSEFKDELKKLGLEPEAVKPILTVHDQRRRLYMTKDGQAFLSISVDHVRSDANGKTVEFAEVEPELNEITFTNASPKTRAYMEQINSKVIQDLTSRFPFLQRDLTPKYKKSYDRLKENGAFKD